MKPKLFSLFLFACLVLPVGILLLVLSMQREQVRHQVKKEFLQNVDSEKLVKFSFHKSQIDQELSWKHKNEFEYQQKMYDVVSREFHGDTITFLCFPDKQETKINRELDRVLAFALGQQPERQQQEQQLLIFFKSLFIIEPLSWKASIIQNEYIFKNTNSVFLTRHITTDVPPPWRLA